MNKFTFDNLSSPLGLLSLGIIGLWISPILTLNAFAGIEISIDPYNDSGFDRTPVMIQPQPMKNNFTSSVTNNPQLPTGNQNNKLKEVFINGNSTPNRPQVVSGNVIKSHQSLPQIPTLSEPYRSLNHSNDTDNEIIRENSHVLSISSVSPFDQTPSDNQSTVYQKPVNQSDTMRSIDLSPHSTPSPNNRVIIPSVSPLNSASSSTETNIPSITTPSNLPKRRSLNDILVQSNPVNPSSSNSVSPVASASPSGVYKVLVGVNNQNQEFLVKSLYPEAFRTVFKGKSMLQVGVFSTVNNAHDVARSLQTKGLKTQITN